MLAAAIIVAALMLSSCGLGGGIGTLHVPPTAVDSDSSMRVQLGLAPKAGTFTDVVCLYRYGLDEALKSVPMAPVVKDADPDFHLFEALIPTPAEGKVTYSFAYKASGKEHKRDGATVSVRAR